MAQINIHDAKTHFSSLIERVQGGEEILIARAGKPVARLVPLASAGAARTFGKDRGRFRVPDDFDAPLPESVLAEFEGGGGSGGTTSPGATRRKTRARSR